ncbi:hypothetical protein B0H16DRAFT_1859447 [Mycena metata]|uniref:Uncharacterized protein n=1 Tax=Mycena metata TaxID=1033252 RepID=A0AAD7NUD3_9AGAR|nr:hypothetical protein B0H16DRAFT_1859447 [Mycena metata]
MPSFTVNFCASLMGKTIGSAVEENVADEGVHFRLASLTAVKFSLLGTSISAHSVELKIREADAHRVRQTWGRNPAGSLQKWQDWSARPKPESNGKAADMVARGSRIADAPVCSGPPHNRNIASPVFTCTWPESNEKHLTRVEREVRATSKKPRKPLRWCTINGAWVLLRGVVIPGIDLGAGNVWRPTSVARIKRPTFPSTQPLHDVQWSGEFAPPKQFLGINTHFSDTSVHLDAESTGTQWFIALGGVLAFQPRLFDSGTIPGRPMKHISVLFPHGESIVCCMNQRPGKEQVIKWPRRACSEEGGGRKASSDGAAILSPSTNQHGSRYSLRYGTEKKHNSKAWVQVKIVALGFSVSFQRSASDGLVDGVGEEVDTLAGGYETEVPGCSGTIGVWELN